MSEPLRRCLRLLDAYIARQAPPWRAASIYGQSPAPLTLAELRRLWDAQLHEVATEPLPPDMAAVLADPTPAPPPPPPPPGPRVVLPPRFDIPGGLRER